MTGLDLRPLSLGEILDRTFSLYRRNFLLFMGIAGIPALLTLAASVTSTLLGLTFRQNPLLALVPYLLLIIPLLIAYLFSQGATILAVTDLYLGRNTGIAQSLRRVWGNLLSLLGVILLNGLVVVVCCLALVVPGIYMACRLFVCLPSAIVEDRGPRESLTRSFELTRGFAGRSFVIFVLYYVIALAIGAVLTWPFQFIAFIVYGNNQEMMQLFTLLAQVGSTIGSTLVAPVLLIATSVFYFDLRVRKEAFDLQFMLDPTSERTTRGEGSVPSILS